MPAPARRSAPAPPGACRGACRRAGTRAERRPADLSQPLTSLRRPGRARRAPARGARRQRRIASRCPLSVLIFDKKLVSRSHWHTQGRKTHKLDETADPGTHHAHVHRYATRRLHCPLAMGLMCSMWFCAVLAHAQMAGHPNRPGRYRSRYYRAPKPTSRTPSEPSRTAPLREGGSVESICTVSE